MKDKKTIVNGEYNQRADNNYRWKNTINLLPKTRTRNKTVLDIGDRSQITDTLEKVWNCSIETSGSESDFDTTTLRSHFMDKRFDIILSFEVIEHLLNPLHHMMQVKSLLADDGIIYLTSPKRKPEFLWSKLHFNEMSLGRLTYLIDKAGLRIVRTKAIRTLPWWFYFTGFRPLLRLFVDRTFFLEIKHKDK